MNVYVVKHDDFYLSLEGIYDSAEKAINAARALICDEYDTKFYIHVVELNKSLPYVPFTKSNKIACVEFCEINNVKVTRYELPERQTR